MTGWFEPDLRAEPRLSGERASSTRHFYFIIPHISSIFHIFTFSHILTFFISIPSLHISPISFSPPKKIYTHSLPHSTSIHINLKLSSQFTHKTYPQSSINLSTLKNLPQSSISKKLSTFLISQFQFHKFLIFNYVV